MKKTICIMIAVILVFSMAGVALAAPPAGAEVAVTPALLSGQQLYATNSPTIKDSPDYKLLEAYVAQNCGVNQRIYQATEFLAYDSHLEQIVDDADFNGTPHTFDFSNGDPNFGNAGCTYDVLHVSYTGQVESDSTPGTLDTTTSSGFGLFAAIETSPTPFLTEIPCTGLPSGEKLYLREKLGQDSPQYQ
ncbi:MAG: hypothetical protein RR716_07895, partial [Christensenellaceae bacterium]